MEAAPPVPPPPPPSSPPNNTISTIGWIGTGVFGAVGLGTGLGALALAGSVKGQCTGNVCPTSAKGDADTSSTLGNVSTVTLILAGGCLVLAILTHHGAPSRTQAVGARTSFDFFVGPGSLNGTF